MKVQGRPRRTIWLAEDGWAVEIIDQTRLPHHFETVRLEALAVPKPRRPTRPSRGAIEKRLDAKRRTGVRKQQRRKPEQE